MASLIGESMPPPQQQQQWIYHEKQEAALCGVHAVNSLLQGPYFSAIRFAEIAQALDARERELMFSQGVNTPDAIRFAAAESSNVDASGNFSISVLQTAVHEHSGLTLTRWQSGKRDDPSTAAGFVLNQSDHWFTLRPVFQIWWNLDSTLAKPTKVGPTYLSAFLAQMSMSGYTIFEVDGNVPPPVQPRSGVSGNPNIWGNVTLERQPTWGMRTNWHTVAELLDNSSELRNQISTVESQFGSEEEQLRLAIAASISEQNGSTVVIGSIVQNSHKDDGEEDSDLRAALAMSLTD